MRSRFASILPAILVLVLAAIAWPGGAQAGVATSGAVLLDPFDPVPEIQFHHFGGYGCSYGCGIGYRGCDEGCGGYGGCHEGCRRHYRHHDCDDDCGRHAHDCDRDCEREASNCDHDCGDDKTPSPPCTSGHCYDAVHYERRWRDGDHVGQEWMDRGRRERMLPDGSHSNSYYGRSDSDWRDDDDAGPPPPPPPPPDHHDHDRH